MSVQQATGMNGLPTLLLSHPSGASAELYLYGAHLTSWVPAGGEEALFLSRAAKIGAGQAIRGGVPVIFPQFAQRGPLPKHGFARLQDWRVLDPPGESSVALELVDSAESRSLWPHPFRARLTVELGERTLSQRLSVWNAGGATFSFTAALHGYFAVADVRRATVEGLQGARYRVSGDQEDRVDEAEEVRFAGELDRVYADAPGPVRLRDGEGGRVLELRREGFADVVVWNPGAELTARLPDMEPDGYLRMVCVEAAQAARPVELPPGGSWEGAQSIVSP
jgi:glucose-6-phosphate 1-epimerase